MISVKKLSALAVSLLLVPVTAHALSLQDGAEPAEFPPASYTADVYVDSRGCVYIRAGFSGAVTWVPRVTRDRNVVCGQQPSLGGGTAIAVAPTPEPAPAPTPTPVATPAPPVSEVVSAPAPAPTPVAVAALTPVPAAVPAAPPTPAMAPENQITRSITLTCPVAGANKNVRADSLTIPLKCEAGQVGTISYIVQHRNGDRTMVTVNSSTSLAPVPAGETYVTCPDRSQISRTYTNDGRTVMVRCGPQTVAPVPVGAVSAGAGMAASNPTVVPEGYRVAWTDDRLNPLRGSRTASGDAQMNLLWTQTVPRKLIDTTTGRDVTLRFRGIAYPTIPTPAQVAAVAAGNVVLITSNAPVPASSSTPAVASHQYVQVALFGVPANAQNTAARLKVLGLPVRIGNLNRGGKAYQIVLAGPFTQQAALNAALTQVRSAGFADAYLRN